MWIHHVPNEPLHPGLILKRLKRPDPVCRRIDTVGIDRKRFVVARKFAYDPSCRVDDLEQDRRRGLPLEVIIDDRSIRRILAGWLLRRKRRVGMKASFNASRTLWSEKDRFGGRRSRRDLSERRDVIEYPERSSVCADNNVVIFHNKIADRRRRHVQSQRLPILTVVDREINGLFRSGKKQTFSNRVFANCINDAAFRYAAGYPFPGAAAIVSAVNVRPKVIETKRIHCCVCSIGIKSAGVDQ